MKRTERDVEGLRWQFIEALILAFLLVYFLLPKAYRLGLVDRPDQRKRHDRAVPLIGGLAIFAAYVLVLGPVATQTATLLFFAGGGLLIVVGALDDYFDFSPWPRLAAQTVASLCMVASGIILLDLGALLPRGTIVELGILAIPFTIFATVGMINAVNMIDGIDGLSGSLSLVALTGMGVVALAADRTGSVQQLVILGGCIAGFLLFNLRSPLRRTAAAFLGDAGSMFLGFALTWFLIALSQGEERAMPPASALWLVALPLMDTLYSIARRLAARRSPLTPDRRHLHHLLLAAGLSVQTTVAALTAAAAGLAAVGVAGALLDWREFYLAAAFAGLLLAYCIGLSLAWRRLAQQDQITRELAPAGPHPWSRTWLAGREERDLVSPER